MVRRCRILPPQSMMGPVSDEEKQKEVLKRMKEVSRTAEVLENKIEQYYTDCRTKEGTKNESES